MSDAASVAQHNLCLTDGERDELLGLLETALGDVRTEVHRTHSNPSFRDQVLREEGTIRGLLRKLQELKH